MIMRNGWRRDTRGTASLAVVPGRPGTGLAGAVAAVVQSR